MVGEFFGHAAVRSIRPDTRGSGLNAYMNISVRVIGAAAQAQIRALQGQVAQLQGQLAAANATAAAPTGIAGARTRRSIMATGNQIQWTGRQLQYNWTIPLLLAGGAAVKFALDNEKAFTRVSKVYGDTTESVQYFNQNQDKIPAGMTAAQASASAMNNELDALKKNFEALSERYGVNQAEVIETAGAWAAAGASGRDLAVATEESLRAAVLGEMDLAKATEALISVQAQYSLGADDLHAALAQLNSIENQTGASMQDLIIGFEKSAGTAREAGIDVRHLGAMIAALVPATGSAATAGNALKTIISRLMSPTGDAAAVMKEFGVNTADAAWQSSTAIERLTVLAQHMQGTLKESADGGYELSDSQKQVVSSVLGSRYQMNRFLVLMREMGKATNETGDAQSYYQKALDATEDVSRSVTQAQRELDAVLESNPQRLKIIGTTIQNSMANIIQPLIPYIVALAQGISSAVRAFQQLDPAIQKLVLIMAAALLILPMLVRYFGSLLTLVGAFALPFKAMSAGLRRLTTTTSVVNGVTTTVRRSFLALFASWLAAPFKFVAAGFGAVVGALLRMATWFLTLGPISRASAAATTAAWAGARAIFMAMPGVIAAAWSAAMTAMALISSGALGTVLRSWVVSLAYMARFAGAGSIVVRAWGFMTLAMSALWLGFQSLIVKSALGLYPLLSGIWASMWGSMLGIMATAQLKLLSLATTFRLAFLSGWAGFYLAMSAVASKGWVLVTRVWALAQVAMTTLASAFWLAMIRGYGAFQLGLGAVMAGASRVTTGIWAAMHVGMAAISRGFWSFILLGWLRTGAGILAGLRALRAAGPKIMSATTRAITGFIQRGGARLLGIWGLIITSVIGIIYHFRDQIVTIWGNVVAYFSDSSNSMVQLVVRAWNALPQGIANALIAVVTMVRDAALQVYEWFSYINPFARHSPSLVENVTAGMAIVSQQFGLAATAIGGHVRGAYRDIAAFGNAVRNLLGNAASFEEAQQRAKVAEFAPGAVAAFDQLSARLRTLNTDFGYLESQLNAQQSVVDRWQAALDRANVALDAQQDKLDGLRDIQSKWQDGLDAATDRLNEYANAPIAGMGAMSDKIFENEMAQKRLRYEIMKMEEVTGPLDDVRAKIEAINGAQEMLRGEQSALRSAGAGSDILSHYDDQIAALEATKQQQGEAAEAIDNMSKKLEDLQRQGELLDLENSLAFDPLTRQIEQAANAMQELPFETIISGVKSSQAEIKKYETGLAAATAAADAQQAAVDRMTTARDALAQRLDAEEAKLDVIKKSYDEVADAIRAVEETMQGAASAAQTMAEKAEQAAEAAKKARGEGAVSPAVQNFRDAAGGEFAEVGGDGAPIRSDWSDQTSLIEAETQRVIDEAGASFAKLNPFGPLKRGWDRAMQWIKTSWVATTGALGEMFSGFGSGLGIGSGLEDAAVRVRVAWAATVDWFQSNVFTPIALIWSLFWPAIKEFFLNAWDAIKDAFGEIGPEVSKIIDEFKDLGPAFGGIWDIMKITIAVVGGVIGVLLYLALNVFAKTVKPAIAAVVGVVSNLLQIFRGLIQFFSGFFTVIHGIFTLNFGMIVDGFQKMGAGIWNIISGTFGAIWALIEGVVKVIVGIFWGLVDGVIDAATWLWDVLVGHSIIPDIVDGIIFWFSKLWSIIQWVWSYLINPVINAFVWLFDKIVAGLKLWWAGITLAFAALKALGSWFWNNVLSPIWNKATELWTKVSGVFGGFWGGITSAWNGLKQLGNWFKTNVMDPVYDKVTGVWTSIKNWLSNNANMLLSPMKSIVNVVIDAVNAIVNGLNGLADLLPGVDWNIPTIPRLASGGSLGAGASAGGRPGAVVGGPQAFAVGGAMRRANAGFKTNGARAIVGEGKRNHPEYVIPTDPTYRHRARGLLMQAAEKIGMYGPNHGDHKERATRGQAFVDGVPAFFLGGVISDAWDGVTDFAGDVKDGFRDLGRDAVGAIMNPILDAAWNTIDRVGWDPIESPPKAGIQQVRQWVNNTDSSALDIIERLFPVHRPATGTKTQHTTGYPWARWSGDINEPGAGDYGNPVWAWKSGTVTNANSWTTSYGKHIRIEHDNNERTLYAHLSDIMVRVGDRVGAGQQIGKVGSTGNSSGPHLHWEVQGGSGPLGFERGGDLPFRALKEGGVALASRGPTLAAIGDGRYDEAVVPLPYGWRNGVIGSSGGDTIININGDLSFPNIKDGDGADKLIQNLKDLAED